MSSIPLDIVGAVTGLIGAITGIISLVWLIIKAKAKLKLELAYFVEGGFKIIKPRACNPIGVELLLRNLGNRSVTIEHIYITIGNIVESPPFFKPITIPASSSQKLQFDLNFSNEEFKDLPENGEIKFEVLIIHTFGRIKKSAYGGFETGHFNIY